MFEWVKRLLGGQRKRLDVLYLPGFRSIVTDVLAKVEGKNYATNERNREGYSVGENTIYKNKNVPGIKKGSDVQVICGWHSAPVGLNGEDTTKFARQSVEAMAARVTREEIAWEKDHRKKAGLTLWIGIVMLILSIGIAVPLILTACHANVHVPLPNSGSIIPPH